MTRILEKVGERLLGRVLPTDTAEAVPCCGGGCGYEYRCLSTGWYQRRYCCTGCSCSDKNCGTWRNYLRGC